MQTTELIAPCHFGMESILKREIYDLGYDITSVDNGRVTFAGDMEAVARANISLWSAERILLKTGEFKASSFDDLFEGTKAIPWADYLPADARFWVTKAASVRSKLFSPSDIQSIMKKAMVDSMAGHYGISVFPEDGASYPVRVMIKDDIVTVALDTTGESLHKRGYRKFTVKAPIAENLAASLLMLTPWSAERILVDPFCGSGTFPIEAALISANIAPGLHRAFTAETWDGLIPASLWEDVREEAGEAVDPDIETDIQGYDIDPAAVEAARNNARLAGVEKLIHFQVRDISKLSHHGKYGFLIANPPYGERLLKDDPEIWQLYAMLGERFKALDSWSMYLISAYEQTEAALGIKAARNRKIYNGMLRSYFYQFPGPKPAGRRKERP
ncbi:MAG: class I SAM-dependent RNA methyltransferase [Lachnospiraceae bacterium]|nr:class I SAM-dependent RNA methyltransferase [Lachnospiraceae bacterium]